MASCIDVELAHSTAKPKVRSRLDSMESEIGGHFGTSQLGLCVAMFMVISKKLSYF